jgi:hypothetical protein
MMIRFVVEAHVGDDDVGAVPVLQVEALPALQPDVVAEEDPAALGAQLLEHGARREAPPERDGHFLQLVAEGFVVREAEHLLGRALERQREGGAHEAVVANEVLGDGVLPGPRLPRDTDEVHCCLLMELLVFVLGCLVVINMAVLTNMAVLSVTQ